MNFDINKIIEKLRYNPNSVKKNYDGKTDIYLAKVSYRYGYFTRILSIIFLVVIVAFLLSGTLSYEKLFYLTKDIKLANDYVNSVHDTITYNVGNSQDFAVYRGGLAVASREKLSIFSAGGREIFSSNHSLGNPTLEVSDQNVLLYDVGGKQFSLYNSFTKMKEETLEYSIYGADMAENGDFALITKSEKYDSVVKVYKGNKTTYNYNFSIGRVFSVSLSKNGKQLAVLLGYSEGAQMKSEIRLYTVGKSDYKSEKITFSGVPYELKIVDNGAIFVVGEKGVNVFNSSLSLTGEYLSDSEIYLYSFGEDNIAIADISGEAGRTQVLLLNKRARVDKEYKMDEPLISISLLDNKLFLQKLGGFEKIDTVSGKTFNVSMVASDFKMIPIDKDTVIVCNDSYAKFIEFDN